MVNEWEFSKTTGRCAATGQEFAEGEAYFAALFDGPEGLQRRDYCVESWTGPPEGSFCYWRGRVPVKEKKPAIITVNQDLLIHLFIRLEDEESQMKQKFRFILALLLMRKRLLKFEQAIPEGEHEYWQMRLVKDQSTHKVLNPSLTNEEVDRLSNQLTAILSGDVDMIETLEQIDAGQPPSQEQDHGTAETDTNNLVAESEDEIASP